MTTDPLNRPQPLSIADTTAAVDAAMHGRRSIRAFLPDPVPRETIHAILDAAARAPSGTNTQPWKVYVVSGEARRRLVDEVRAAHDNPQERAAHGEAYHYYPTQWVSPYVDRRRKVGWDLYGLLGIGRADKDRMHAQHGRNYAFFDAPVGLLFTLDRVMAQAHGPWIDLGMFLQSVMLAARARGLDTCPQAAWATFHRIVTRHIGAGEGEIFVCGMALGHADPAAVENTLRTEREPVQGFARFLDA
jgi:nitroreductase